MQLIPVIDLMDGAVVRGYAGQRELYQPSSSRLVSSSEPAKVLQAFSDAYHPDLVYVADLDGIRFGRHQTAALKELSQQRLPLAVDGGVRCLEDAELLFACGVSQVIVGLETLPDMSLLQQLVQQFGKDKIIFSLDMTDGRANGPAAKKMRPLQIALEAIEAGVHQMIVLEFSKIGTNSGVPTGSLCHTIKLRRPDVVVWTGGGIRNLMDVHKLRLSHVDAVMISSALHEGLISPSDWQAFQSIDFDRTLLAMDA